MGSVSCFAQEHINVEDRVVDLNSPTFVPMVHIGKAKVGGDSIQYVRTNKIYIYPPLEFKNDKQRQAYNRLVANIKRCCQWQRMQPNYIRNRSLFGNYTK